MKRTAGPGANVLKAITVMPSRLDRGGQPVRDQESQFSMCCCKIPHETRGHTCTKIISIFLMIAYVSFALNYYVVKQMEGPGKLAFTEEAPQDNL